MNLEDRFWDYHRKNPRVYRLFHQFALEILYAGRKRYSIWALANRIRWFVDIETRDSNSRFKISNDYLALYARLLVFRDARFDGLFKLKQTSRIRFDFPTGVPEATQ